MYRSVFIFVLFASSASASTSAGQTGSHFDEVEEKCINETIKDNPVKERRENLERLILDTRNLDDLFKNQTSKCYSACMLRESGLVKIDGSLKYDKIIEKLQTIEDLARRNELATAFNKCSHESGVGFCDTAYRTSICLYEQEVIRRHPPKLSEPQV